MVADALQEVACAASTIRMTPKKAKTASMRRWPADLASSPWATGVSRSAARWPDRIPTNKTAGILKNDDHINGGVNHFGSPFNFP